MPKADIITEEMITRYEEDGVLFIRQALSPAWLELIEIGIKRNLATPGPFATRYFEGEPGEFYDDHCNYEVIPEYRRLLEDSPIGDMMKKLLQTENLWLFYDQIFIKEGGWSRRTPWHQDTPYFVAEGKQIGSMWITLDDVSGDESLEFIPGSHRGPLYNGAYFGGEEENSPYYDDANMPRLPNIEAERDKWNIVSWPIEPGDVLVLHPSILHGGAQMREGGRRRTMSIRFFGDDIRYVERPGKPAPPFPGLAEALRPGDLLRHPYFPLIRGND